MEADLVDVKQLFSNMMKGVQPWILSHFIMWLDLKVAEYKVLGYMVLDKKSAYDKELQGTSSKTSTPSPAISEHMYVLPEPNNGQQNSPSLPKENKEYDNFAELVQHNKRKNSSVSGIPLLDNTQKCINKHLQDSDAKDQEICENKTLENGTQNQRKQRKPGKVLHSIVNNLKQNCNKTGNQSIMTSQDTDKGHSSILSTSVMENGRLDKMCNKVEQNSHTLKDRVVSLTTAKAYTREPPPPLVSQETSDVDEDNTPLYKSQQFSSLISLSRSRGRRRRSSNDEITYPLITMKDAEIPQTTYDEEPRSQNLADFYFAQNQLDEQFAVRRAKQSICRLSNKSSNERDSSEADGVFYPSETESSKKDEGLTTPSNIPRFPSIKQERMETECNEHQGTQSPPKNQSNFDPENSNHSNISQNGRTNDKIIIVKSEPQNDQEYYVSSTGGQYERLSNQSFSSEGDTSSYHDNSAQFEYHGDDIADESYVFNNSELYGDDYIGTPGTGNHDNKMMRPKSFKKRPITCSPNLVPRDPTSGKFVCELCGGTFTNRSSYFRHKRIHGEKKFRCFLCDKAFHRKEHLQSHIHRHTKSFPLKCGQCNFESHSLDEATTHFQAVHNQDNKESP